MKLHEVVERLMENPHKKFYTKGRPHLIAYAEEGRICFRNTIVPNSEYRYDPSIEHEWEEINEPVSFLEAIKSGKRIRVEHDLINELEGKLFSRQDITESFNTYHAPTKLLDLLLDLFSEHHFIEIILKGKWYIE